MPALKPSRRQEAIGRFVGLLDGYLFAKRMTNRELAKRMKISSGTLTAIRKDPLRMNRYESGMMCDILLIPKEEMNATLDAIPRY